MKKLRVLVLVHPDHVPPDSLEGLTPQEALALKAEFDIVQCLRQLGHEARALGVQDEFLPIRDAVEEFKPHVVFNLLEEFHSNMLFDQNVVSLLELLRVPYTGCNPRGLVLARSKSLSQEVAGVSSHSGSRFPRYSARTSHAASEEARVSADREEPDGARVVRDRAGVAGRG